MPLPGNAALQSALELKSLSSVQARGVVFRSPSPASPVSPAAQIYQQ